MSGATPGRNRQDPAGARLRLQAARCVEEVLNGRSLAGSLPAAVQRVEPRQRALLQELCYGTLRWQPRLKRLLALCTDRPLRRRDRLVEALTLVGLQQLLNMRIPAHAAVAETVAAGRRSGRGPWVAGFLNGVLRRVQRERAELLARLDDEPEARLAHPAWLLERWQRDWPDDWEAIAAANNRHPPMVLRVALDRLDRAACLRSLAAGGIEARAHPLVPSAVELAVPTDVDRLPGFHQGLVSVQDAAAQLAAPLLALEPGLRVLDACAAPGGKTGHILECEAGLAELVAVDQDPRRLARVGDNLQRLKRTATLLSGDASRPQDWWDGRLFDRVLLDVPCSATGVIRRHPDIKLLRRASDAASLSARQRRILAGAWRMLAPGGRLLYCSCSVLRAENEAVIKDFLKHHPEAEELPLEVDWGRAGLHGRQVLPGEQGMDGFFYACLVKLPQPA